MGQELNDPYPLTPPTHEELREKARARIKREARDADDERELLAALDLLMPEEDTQ